MLDKVVAAWARTELGPCEHEAILADALRRAGSESTRTGLPEVFEALAQRPWPTELLTLGLDSSSWLAKREALVELSRSAPLDLVVRLRELTPAREMSVLRHGRLTLSDPLLARVEGLPTGARTALLRAHPEALVRPGWARWLLERSATSRVKVLVRGNVALGEAAGRSGDLVAAAGLLGTGISAAALLEEGTAHAKVLFRDGALVEPGRSAAVHLLAKRWLQYGRSVQALDTSDLEVLASLGPVADAVAEAQRLEVLESYESFLRSTQEREMVRAQRDVEADKASVLAGRITVRSLDLLADADLDSRARSALYGSDLLEPWRVLRMVRKGTLVEVETLLAAKDEAWRTELWKELVTALMSSSEVQSEAWRLLALAGTEELRPVLVELLGGHDWSAMANEWHRQDPSGLIRNLDLLPLSLVKGIVLETAAAAHIHGRRLGRRAAENMLTLGGAFEGTLGELLDVANELA